MSGAPLSSPLERDGARAAAIDIGTNSVLLLIAERRGNEIVSLLERATVTRLGQGVDKTRMLAPDAVERTLACLTRYAEEIRAASVERVAAVGTSAMRDAKGGEAFAARAAEILGAVPRVVSGEEEARLTFAGALAGLSLSPGPVMVFDVGGGSTEMIAGETPSTIEAAISLDIGSVRLTERHIRNDPPCEAELGAVRADTRRALEIIAEGSAAAFGPRPGFAHRIVGVAGTVTTLAALVLDVAPYDGARVHGARLAKDDIARISARLGLSASERRALPALDPARADVIVAGSVIVDEVLAWSSATELVVSDRGVRWGLAVDLFDLGTNMAKKP